MGDIAGILSDNRRVLGLMPHPERAIDRVTAAAMAAAMFSGLMTMMAQA